MADAPAVHHVLWTGGWDSTYRVADLVLMNGRTVQPWYVVDPGRRTAVREAYTMRRIRERIIALDPSAEERLREPNLRRMADLAPEPDLDEALRVQGAREPLTSQQGFLPRLARQEGIERLEFGSTVDDEMDDAYALATLRRNDAPAPDDWWYMDEDGSDADTFRIWGRYVFPLLHLTKLDLARAADRDGFRDVMELTWFCRWPTVMGRPCGYCEPCRVTRQAGVLWRVPRDTAVRRALHTAKWDTHRRAQVLRANLTSVRARLGLRR